MQQTELVVLEVRSDWKASFFKTDGFCSAQPVYQGSDTTEKTKLFCMKYLSTSKKISPETWMKELNNVFLENSELQLLGISILFAFFGVYSMSKIQSDKFQQIYFRNTFVDFWSRRDWNCKKTDPSSLGKIHLITFMFTIFKRPMNF